MNTTKYFAYDPETEGALDGHTMHDEWGDAASEAMHSDGYAFKCREITASDLPIRYNVVDSIGATVDYFTDRDDAEAEAANLAEDGEPHTVEQVAESDFSIGDFGLWVHKRHHGNNLYEPEGIRHADFTGISGADAEECLREYVERDGYAHPRHHIIVAEATFDDVGNLIEADGIAARDAEADES